MISFLVRAPTRSRVFAIFTNDSFLTSAANADNLFKVLFIEYIQFYRYQYIYITQNINANNVNLRATVPGAIRPLVARGLAGSILAPLSFGCVMMATRLDSVGIAAALRETSVLFTAIIGVLFLKETVSPRRICLMALIVAGAILINLG